MRTSFNKGSNENDDRIELEVLPIAKEGIDVSEDRVESVDADFVEVDLEDEIPEVDFSEVEDEEIEFDEIFSDGEFAPITPDYHKINDELEKALKEEEEQDLDDGNTADLDLEDDDIMEEEEDLFADDEGIEDNEDEEIKEEKKSFLNKKIIVGSVIVLVALGASVGYGVMSSKTDAKDLEKQIDRLYTSDRKSELKKGVDSSKLDKCYEKLEDVDAKERLDFEKELNTIAYYIEDKEALDKMGDSSYNFNTSDFKNNLKEIKKSVNAYSVPSLASTLNDKIASIEEDYKTYTNVKSVITKNIGNPYANISELQELVSGVSHTPNKEDLQAILNNIGDEVKANKTINDIKESSNKKLEEVSDKIDNKIDEASMSFGEKMDSFAESVQKTFSSILEGLKNFIAGEDKNR